MAAERHMLDFPLGMCSNAPRTFQRHLIVSMGVCFEGFSEIVGYQATIRSSPGVWNIYHKPVAKGAFDLWLAVGCDRALAAVRSEDTMCSQHRFPLHSRQPYALQQALQTSYQRRADELAGVS